MQERKMMMHFSKLDDSPMFRQQIQCLEENAETFRERSLKFCKGCRKYTEGLGEGYHKDIAFASAMETFGGGNNDPLSVSFGGPDMMKFAIALREIATYKEVLRSEVGSLSSIETKQRFEYLEAVSGTMNAQLRYLKQGYELLHQLEPYINQVLVDAQKPRDRSNYEHVALNGRMQEFKRQVDQETKQSLHGSHGSPNGDAIKPFARNSHKVIEAVMQSTVEGKLEIDKKEKKAYTFLCLLDEETARKTAMNSVQVQTIKQGYLLKRSSNLRGDWKRRFFVLDSRGMLYYYRKQWSRLSGSGNQLVAHRSNPSEPGSGLLSRWLSSHYRGGVHDEKSIARHTVNLVTSTIKVDADQSDLSIVRR